MIVALIIVSVLLVLSLLGNGVLFHVLNVLAHDIMEEQQFEQELAFAAGEIDIPEDEIAQKFLDAILLCNIEKNSNDDGTWKIVDTSSYQKNRIIGLTYFVQPQLFEDLKGDLDVTKLKEKIYKKLVSKMYDDEDDIDEDFVNELLNNAMQEIFHNGEFAIGEEYSVMSHPILPHCTVYQLKDGRWLWRRESC